jgi:septal ring factor EnvC (AmiA/AmiB activator)
MSCSPSARRPPKMPSVSRREPPFFPLLLAALIAAGPAGAAQTEPKQVDKKLEDVQRALEADKARAAALGQRSAQIAKQLDELRRQMIETARSTQEQEQALTELEGTLDELRAAEDDKARALAGRRAQLAATLGALERMALYPPEAIAALPESPVDTVRSALLLRAAVPAVEARAAKLRAALESLKQVRLQIADQRRSIEQTRNNLSGDRRRLASLLTRKGQLLRETEAQRRSAEDRVAKLAGQAKDLRDLMDRIEAERAQREALARIKPALPPSQGASPPPGGGERLASLPPGKPPAIRRMSEAQGRLTLPARGEIVKQYGASEEPGVTAKGITIRTRPDAEVVAPYDGQVVFAGPFRGYGQILIIEHSEGYHTLLSGLSRIDAVPGQWVLAGEPVGTMGPREGGGPELYVELRRNGRPINPLPWLALHNGKVSG